MARADWWVIALFAVAAIGALGLMLFTRRGREWTISFVYKRVPDLPKS